jgi:TusA-related sulfurtransferase
MPINYYSIGYDESENAMLQDAEQAIDKANMWEYMKKNPTGGSYSFTKDPEFDAILKHMRYNDHTGATMEITMKTMQKIARGEFDMKMEVIATAPKAKEVVKRSAEMDAKVIKVYDELPPFKSAPKWAKEYLQTYPQLLATKK